MIYIFYISIFQWRKKYESLAWTTKFFSHAKFAGKVIRFHTKLLSHWHYGAIGQHPRIIWNESDLLVLYSILRSTETFLG